MKILISCLIIVISWSSFAASPDAYSIETIETPKDVLFHVTGLDITEDGRVYCCTRYGDVWVLAQGKWTRFATGLHEPCGLMVDQDGSVIVTQKPEMTKLIDNDNDGVADLYLNLSHAWEFHNNYHEFNFGGIRDNSGNYVGTLNLAAGRNVAGLKLSAMSTEGGYRGWAYKVSPEGKFTAFASGLRSPAGLGKNDLGEIFFTDNQGDYVATSTLNHLEQGKFYGHPISLLDKPEYSMAKLKEMKDEEFEKMRTLPVVWIPQEEIANSPGNPEWLGDSGKFGPFKNQFFIGDQTRSNIFRVSLQKVGGRYQGCVIDFISGLQCGNIRLKFDAEGALWAGQTSRGWASRGAKPFGLQKVVWNKKTIPFEIEDVKLIKDGFKVTFTKEVDPKSVKVANIGISHWWYNYTRDYGSPKVDLKTSELSSVQVQEDGKTLVIKMPLQKQQVYCLDLSQILNKSGQKTHNSKAFYTLINLVE